MNYFLISKILAPFLIPSNYLIFVLIFFLLKKKTYKFNYIFKLLIIFFLLIGTLPFGDFFNYNFFEKKYINTNLPIKIDNIIVLGGSQNLNNSIESNKVELSESSERLFYATFLKKKYPNSKIIFLGGNPLLKKTNISESEIAKNFFFNFELNLNDIIFEDKSKNTIENFLNLKNIENIKLQGKKNILITSAFHMNRAILISKFYDLDMIPFAVDFRSLWINRINLINYYQGFSYIGNIRKFDLIIREILGLVAFKLKILTNT